MIFPVKLPMTHQMSSFRMPNSLHEPKITPKRMCASTTVEGCFHFQPSGVVNYGIAASVDARKPLSGAARWTSGYSSELADPMHR